MVECAAQNLRYVPHSPFPVQMGAVKMRDEDGRRLRFGWRSSIYREEPPMAARQRLGVGIIGAGNISSQYLKAMAAFPVLDIRGIADMKPEVAEKKAAEFGVKAVTVDALLADPAIDIVVNLTIPRAHVAVGLRAIAAGKHVYSEKPIGVTFAEGKTLVAAARRKGVRVGSAPDTFLGGSHQQARAVVDSGKLGTIIGGTANFGVPGHEYWHPDPAFYYDIGG